MIPGELTLDGGMIMLGTARDNDSQSFMRRPADIGGSETRGVSLIVDDADAIYGRAKAAGARLCHGARDGPSPTRTDATRTLRHHAGRMDCRRSAEHDDGHPAFPESLIF